MEGLTGIFVVVHEVEKNYALHEYVSEDRADGDTDVVLLVAVMADIGFEGKHLEDHVQNADNDGGTQEIDIRVKDNLFDHLELASIPTSRWCLALSSLSGSLLGSFINTGDHAEFPVGEVVEVDVER